MAKKKPNRSRKLPPLQLYWEHDEHDPAPGALDYTDDRRYRQHNEHTTGGHHEQ